MNSFILQPENIGKRLDVFVFEMSEACESRAKATKHIKSGAVLINGKRAKPSYALKKDDTIEIQILPKNDEALVPNTTLNIPILYEDEHLIAINKPIGIQVHPSSTERENTVANWIIAKYPSIKEVGEDILRPGIVHRLDKDTSGILLIAKNQKTYLKLKYLFQERRIQKRYLSIVYGNIASTEGIINKPIARAKNFRKQTISQKQARFKGFPREAFTRYKVLKRYESFDLIEARPKTGRMHQIRIHLASLGHPIVGDKLYTNKAYKNYPTAKRQLLHAHQLSFEYEDLCYIFSSKPPHDFQLFIENLQ